MKNGFLALCLTVLTVSMSFAATESATVKSFGNMTEVQALPTQLSSMTAEDLLNMTPAKYQELTGEKLGVKNAIALKAAQKAIKNKLKNPAEDLDKTVYILLAIVGLGFIGIGLLSDWSGNEWIIALILSVLCWLPGVIYSLIKMKNYY
ncbi:MAG: hypothetical protein SF053_19445 [Bacteroidia bacterium]|nr:hypothetical protein [Bacteroidia bacterium]